jgi:hypothetical protein
VFKKKRVSVGPDELRYSLVSHVTEFAEHPTGQLCEGAKMIPCDQQTVSGH